MKSIKYMTILSFVLLAFSACDFKKKSKVAIAEAYQCPMHCEGTKTYGEPGSCPVCKMDLQPTEGDLSIKGNESGISEESIFNLTSKWHTQDGDVIQLQDLKGKTLVMVMIYTSCKAACPRLVADMRNIESEIPSEKVKNIRFVLVSIDPETDTPQRLKAFAIENLMDDEQWTFLQGTESGIREFANVLAVKYKQISPMDFSHSNIISVFNSNGELVHQQEGLGVDNNETVETILQLTR